MFDIKLSYFLLYTNSPKVPKFKIYKKTGSKKNQWYKDL